MKYLIAVLLVVSEMFASAQDAKNLTVEVVAFYNLENLFDLKDDIGVRDTEFTPEGSKHWVKEKYDHKLNNIATVLTSVAKKYAPQGPALIGVSEIENRAVLEDLVNTDLMKPRNYGIVHYDSPDKRGIDVALLYRKDVFEVMRSEAHPVTGLFYDDGDTVFTRDVLVVSGKLNGELVHVLVNHWPSRRGGEKASRPRRNYVASICRHVIDDLELENPDAKILLMGDLNDDPTNVSVRKHLKAVPSKKAVGAENMFNPYEKLYKKGIGTTAWRDAWSLFDQIIISPGLLKRNAGDGYYFLKGSIYNESWLKQSKGNWAGYPYRTFVGDKFTGGYSDHFPVYIVIGKALN